jgi:hypothetical protein
MRRFVLPLSIILSGVVPLLTGWLGAGWLINRLWPQESEALFAWVLGMVTAVSLTLLLIAGWALYRDKLWRGLMHPLAFMSSIVLVLLALLSLPALWGQLRLLAEGVTAVATIESLTTGIDYDPENNITNTVYYMTYRFTAEDGEHYSERVQVSQSIYQSSSKEDDISITYLPDQPGYSLPEAVIQPEIRARRIFTYLLAVLVLLGETAVVNVVGRRMQNLFH